MLTKDPGDATTFRCIGCGAVLSVCCPDVLRQAAQDHAHCRSHYAIGNQIARATKAVGVAPCGGCKQRQHWLNRLVPRWR